jgi:hypothetical protein
METRMSSLAALAALAGLKELSGVALPVRAALKVRRLLRELGSIAEDVEAERVRLLAQYARKGADGQPEADERNQARFSDDAARESFERDYNELMASEHLVTGEALRAAELGDSVVVKPAVLVALGELLEDG